MRFLPRHAAFVIAMLVGHLVAAGPVAIAQESAGGTVPDACGTRPITIARMQWPSAAILAQIHALLLASELGCTIQVVAGDNAATTSSMAATAEPAIAPELWIARAAGLWNLADGAQKARDAGQTYAGGAIEGWFIPDYVAANHPGFSAISSLKDYWQVFVPPGGTKARFVSCPPDWACALVNRHLIEALGLQARFEIIEPENRFRLDTLIADAVSRREPILFYYWQPNPILGQLQFQPLDMGPYQKDALACLASEHCPDPQPSAFAPEPVIIALADWVFAEAPEVARYFQRARMPLEIMNQLLAWQNAEAASPEQVAAHFVATNPEIWRPWVAAD